MDDAYKRGARRFAVVYDKTYKFGVEGAAAFKAEVSRLPGTKPMGDSCDARYCGASCRTEASRLRRLLSGRSAGKYANPKERLTALLRGRGSRA